MARLSWLNIYLTMSSEKRIYYVYAYLRSKNSERGPKYSPYYIGKGCGQRAFNKKRAIAAPADKSFIVFLEEGLTETEAFALEKYAVSLYGRIDKGMGILWNMTDGGEGCSGVIMSEETRAKIARALTGKKRPPEVIKKMAKGRTGILHTEETKRKMSESRRGKKKGPHSDAAKQRISEGKAKYEYEVTDPNGNTYMTRSLNMLCKEHGLLQSHMSATARGEMNGYKGWKVRIVQNLQAASSGNEPSHHWHTSDEVTAQRKERKRLYDKDRYDRRKVDDEGQVLY
jgi:hypothetical protein